MSRLCFVNDHLSNGNVPATVPAKPDPLPNDVKIWMDEATDGAIFLVSEAIKSTHLSSDILRSILYVFLQQEQHIMRKWEDDDLPNKPSNVMIGMVAARRHFGTSVRVFFSHCGKGSVNEAKYHGVPLLGMAIFVDQ